MKIKNVLYLPSGRVFILDLEGYTIEATEMRDVCTTNTLVRNTLDYHLIWKNLVPFTKKWLLTISTQRGCVHKCKFCDVPSLPFQGNLTYEEMMEQVNILLEASPYVTSCEKIKLGFARMGEPSWNMVNVFKVIKDLPKKYNFTWLPCFNSILPKQVEGCIEQVLDIKENICKGFLHFQISCNSTDEQTRKSLFGGAEVTPIEEIIQTINKFNITKRTVTLNFIVMEGIEISIPKLKAMGLNKDRFTVKLIPMNKTTNAQGNNLESSTYLKLQELQKEFQKEGIPVVMDSTAKCEEAGLCCGQLAQIFQ